MMTTTTPSMPRGRYCAHCEYDLRGLAVARCPECGQAFDPTAPPPAQVPWLVRGEIGAYAAYWRTVSLVILRPRQFAEQVRATSSGDARGGETFRLVTVALAAVSFALATALLALSDSTVPIQLAGQRAASIGCTAAVALFVFFMIVTLPVRVDLFRPQTWDVVMTFPHLQKFGCAGLAWSPAIPLCAAVVAGAARLGEPAFAAQGMALTAAVTTAVMVAWCRGGVMYVRLAGRPGGVQATVALIWWLLLLLAGSLAAAATAALIMPVAELLVWLCAS